MIREEEFLISRAPYAVDLSSLAKETYYGTVRTSHRYTLKAAWFRRRNGVTVACLGFLNTRQDTETANAALVLERLTDGRYGGDCKARWDGRSLWAPEANWDQMAEYEAFLRPMLENFPEVPPSFDGWWTQARNGRYVAGAQR